MRAYVSLLSAAQAPPSTELLQAWKRPREGLEAGSVQPSGEEATRTTLALLLPDSKSEAEMRIVREQLLKEGWKEEEFNYHVYKATKTKQEITALQEKVALASHRYGVAIAAALIGVHDHSIHMWRKVRRFFPTAARTLPLCRRPTVSRRSTRPRRVGSARKMGPA